LDTQKSDKSYEPAGDSFYEFQKEHQTVQQLKKKQGCKTNYEPAENERRA
jgi:hypothetical protein